MEILSAFALGLVDRDKCTRSLARLEACAKLTIVEWVKMLALGWEKREHPPFGKLEVGRAEWHESFIADLHSFILLQRRLASPRRVAFSLLSSPCLFSSRLVSPRVASSCLDLARGKLNK